MNPSRASVGLLLVTRHGSRAEEGHGVQRLARRSPKPKVWVQFLVPLPRPACWNRRFDQTRRIFNTASGLGLDPAIRSNRPGYAIPQVILSEVNGTKCSHRRGLLS